MIEEGHFLEYGRIKFFGKQVAVGVTNINGTEYNKAYYVDEDGKTLLPLGKNKDSKCIKSIFGVDTPSIDFNKGKIINDRLHNSEYEKMEDIDIESYMPPRGANQIDDEIYDEILSLLKKIQNEFPFITAENLKYRLPDLNVEDCKGTNAITNAFYKPKSNFLGMCNDGFGTEEGRAVALHELNHMASSSCEAYEEGSLYYSERTGFGDESRNGLAITEGFNELFSAMARDSEPISYDYETGWAQTMIFMSKDPAELIKNFYSANYYGLKDIGVNERESKKLIKCMDFFNASYYYNVNAYCSVCNDVIKETKNNFLKCKRSTMIGYTLSPDEEETIKKMVLETMETNFAFPFTDSTFVSEIEIGLLNKYEDYLNSKASLKEKQDATLSMITSTIFSFNIDDDLAKQCDLDSIKKVDEKFYDLCHRRGLSDEVINELITNADEILTEDLDVDENEL